LISRIFDKFKKTKPQKFVQKRIIGQIGNVNFQYSRNEWFTIKIIVFSLKSMAFLGHTPNINNVSLQEISIFYVI